MTNSHEIKEKVKERYGRVAKTGDSCCGPLGSIAGGGGCCSGNSNVILKTSQSAAQVSELAANKESIADAVVSGAQVTDRVDLSKVNRKNKK
jgi:arsenite methyltransferase